MVFEYAEEIFSTGDELMDALRGRPSQRPAKLLVGVADVVPKLVSYRLLQTALELDDPVQLVLYEGKADELISELASQRYDMVLTDMPLNPQTVRVRAYNHPLGSSGVTFFAEPRTAKRYRRGFPESLDGAPMLMPTQSASLRHSLDQWFESLGVKPEIVAEIEDTALMKVFGQHGVGVFAAPTVVAKDVKRSHGVAVVGETADVREDFYAITVERRIAHPAVAAIAEAARTGVLA